MKNVVVLGGGFAGLAATIKLTELGHKVTLVERRQNLGGRAFSITDPTTGDTIDNGQHLFMKCYWATLHLLKTLGAHDNIVFQDEFQLEYRHPINGIATLRFPKYLPAPLNVLAGFLRFKAVTFKDIMPLGKLKPELKKTLPSTLSVAQWLTQCKQTTHLQDVFWNPLCLAALNESPHQASAQHLQAVLNEAFFSSSDGSLLGYARVGLSNLLFAKAKSYFFEHDQTLNLGCHVKKLDVASPQKIILHLSNGHALSPDAVISALPPQALSQILPTDHFADLLQHLTLFRPSPILSVNLWYDRPTLTKPMIGMLGTKMEWAFHKKSLYQEYDHASQGHITLIASAARQLAKMPHKEVIELAHQEFQSVVPAAKQAVLQHARVICEHRATQTLPLGKSPPTAQTHHPKLILAGDWVNTGLPATIESAVRSGFQAANLADKT